ncbi:phosphate ABC transporter permease PstA [Lachnospiraceae bacterium NSJ-143]|nr:phosphate ABC transporter permease PstA [Lachnospiraceae bacterium NSJ-143]
MEAIGKLPDGNFEPEKQALVITPVNRLTLKQRAAAYKNRPFSFFLLGLVTLAAAATILVFLLLIGYIFAKGVPNIKPELFAWEYSTENVSMLPSIINTFLMTFATLMLAVPIGVFSAVYLVEYAKRGSRLVSAVRITTETLAGIPSIVYGLFGYLMFASALKWGYTFIGGVLTLTIMVLPTMMRTTEEALKAVPDSFREGSFGLGAGKLRTVFSIVLPSAVPGIFSGVVLSTGRIVGETAALIFTAGTKAAVPKDIFSSTRTLAVHMYSLLSEGLYINQAYATAVVILVMVIAINAVSSYLAGMIVKKH